MRCHENSQLVQQNCNFQANFGIIFMPGRHDSMTRQGLRHKGAKTFLTAILHRGLRNDFFCQVTYFFSIFYLDFFCLYNFLFFIFIFFYLPFFPFIFWTFISFFLLNFSSISVHQINLKILSNLCSFLI